LLQPFIVVLMRDGGFAVTTKERSKPDFDSWGNIIAGFQARILAPTAQWLKTPESFCHAPGGSHERRQFQSSHPR
jgi:hypothetical protein